MGASAILIYNNVEGDFAGEVDVNDTYIPTGAISKETGEILIDLLSKNSSSNMYQLRLETKSSIITSQNIIAETKVFLKNKKNDNNGYHHQKLNIIYIYKLDWK